MRDDEGRIAHDPLRAALVLEMFERYSTTNWSDRELAIWLTSTGARTARGEPFKKDTVREMMVNAAYAGYVTGRRDKSQTIKGNYEPIVPWSLFQRVQEIRGLRTRTLNPGRPGGGYALSGILRCERCGSKMHGTTGGRNSVRRYQCSKRKQDNTCDAPIVLAVPLEEAVAEYVRAFDPPPNVRHAVVRRLKEAYRSNRNEADQTEHRAAASWPA